VFSPADGRPPRVALVMLAAGEGRRSGHHTNKVLLPLAGRRVFTWSIRWGRLLPDVSRTVLVIRDEDRDSVRTTLAREVEPPDVELVVGGDTRHASEWNALRALAPAIRSGEIDVVVIHDAARPLAGTPLFAEVVAAAAHHGGAIPVRAQGHLAALDGGAPPSDQVVAVQTPQAFLAEPLLEAYTDAASDGFLGTDTASCMERYTDLAVQCVPGDARNIKITFPEDLFLAERLLARSGFDLSGATDHKGHVPLPHLRDLWHPGRRR
jgi:2-C-methyl-D-erythritol 4-phosphate cytidylyltransferase